VRTTRLVFPSLGSDQLLCLLQVGEPVCVQTLGPEDPIEAFHERVVNFAVTNSEGRNGPFGIECLRAEEKGQLAPTLFLAFDCEPAIADIAGTILPLATLPSFAVIGKSHEKEVGQFLSTATAAPANY